MVYSSRRILSRFSLTLAAVAFRIASSESSTPSSTTTSISSPTESPIQIHRIGTPPFDTSVIVIRNFLGNDEARRVFHQVVSKSVSEQRDDNKSDWVPLHPQHVSEYMWLQRQSDYPLFDEKGMFHPFSHVDSFPGFRRWLNVTSSTMSLFIFYSMSEPSSSFSEHELLRSLNSPLSLIRS